MDALSGNLIPFETEISDSSFSSPFSVDYQPSLGPQLVFTSSMRAEVTKSVYFDLRFVVLSEHGELLHDFVPSASLRYEEGSPVSADIFDGNFVSNAGECILNVRINELSKNHRNQRFQVQVEAAGSFGRVAAITPPIKVLSKTSIVQSHLRQNGSHKRKRNIEPLCTTTVLDHTQVVTPASNPPTPGPVTSTAAAPTAQTAVTQQQITALQQQLTLLSSQVSALLVLLQGEQGIPIAAQDDMPMAKRVQRADTAASLIF